MALVYKSLAIAQTIRPPSGCYSVISFQPEKRIFIAAFKAAIFTSAVSVCS